MRTMKATVAIPDAAFQLGEDYLATWKRVLRRELLAERVGTKWRVDAADLERLKRERAKQPAA